MLKCKSIFILKSCSSTSRPLQINPDTYSKEQFYLDKTNLIRYKTPEFSFQQLIDPDQQKSPLYRIKATLKEARPFLKEDESLTIEKELKLLGNMVRSSLRTEVNTLIHILHSLDSQDDPTLLSSLLLPLSSLRTLH